MTMIPQPTDTVEPGEETRASEAGSERPLVQTTADGAGTGPTRRSALKFLTTLGVGTATFRRALAVQAEQAGASEVSVEMVKQAEWVAGLDLTDAEREATARSLQRSLKSFRALRQVELGYDIPPALAFNPAPAFPPSLNVTRNQASPIESNAPKRPESDAELAFLPVTELSALVRARRVSSVELTRLYLDRLQRFDPLLKCVVNLTEETALNQARRADNELSAGHYRGPLHGIPWGAKDLIAYPGYPTTWGAPQFKDRVINEKATVARRLEEAGAVLVAKLTLGALAQGDRWFGGMTRTPWDPRLGSSGSSAGSASAVAAGLVGFAIGSETLGSIVSPSRACGTSGLRPTFGRVSRHGCMSLSWSMDKLGPIARSVQDCALVLDAIHGFDGLDPSAVDHPFTWPSRKSIRGMRIGYLENPELPLTDREELRVLRELGAALVPIVLPSDYPTSAITLMLRTEAASAFDELTRNHVTEGLNTWPNAFLQGQFTPAVEYLRAARVRTLLMRSMAKLMESVDLYVSLTEDLEITNLTGHPCVVLPNGFETKDGRDLPGSLTFTGQLFDEANLLAVAHAYQDATGHHLKHPPLERYLAEEAEKPA